jgi:hypothetical protein
VPAGALTLDPNLIPPPQSLRLGTLRSHLIRNNVLSVENKLGAKKEYFQSSPVNIQTNKWFTVKVHLKFNNGATGIIELWQDGTQVISATGINLPTSNSIQNRVEVGVTSTSVGCVLLVDNIRISASPF